MLVILSGPSGVGKNRMIDLATSNLGFGTLAPYTTRERRAGEIPGRDYWYVGQETFQSMIRNGDFLDWDYTLRNYYGCPMEVARLAESSSPYIIHALARMAIRISQRLEKVLLIFLNSNDEVVLGERIGMRGYSPLDYFLRTEHWHEEKIHSPMFNAVIQSAELLTDSRAIEILRDARDKLRHQPP